MLESLGTPEDLRNQPHLVTSAALTTSTTAIDPLTAKMSLYRCSARPIASTTLTVPTQQIRHATLIRRPKTPYTFTQLITLSDGSTFLHRTTSPQPIYRSTKDTKNHPMWNPSSQKLLNVEEDEAGRLRRFRARFGRGFDAEVVEEGEEVSVARVYHEISRVRC